jgi:cell division protein FtsW
MARRVSQSLVPAAASAGERQTTIFERLDTLARHAGERDPRAPALALFLVVLALLGIGLLIQASHAATTRAPAEFLAVLRSQILFRAAGLILLLLAARLGPAGLRRQIPAALVVSALLLVAVFVPPTRHMVNGSCRWVDLGVVVFQPSELARLFVVLWIADRAARLGGRVREVRAGVLPMLAVALLFFLLIAVETDIGGAMLLLLCAFATMWIGGARLTHVLGTFTTIAGTALAVGFSSIPYVRERIESFFGERTEQISDGLSAMHSGGLWGLGLGQGIHRNLGVPYLESDLVFAQVGEELGFFGMLLVLGLFALLLWHGSLLVLSIRDRFSALACFGLLVSTALQAMLHVQVVAGLAPPKGMTLPFISHGGTSLVVSCLGIGLALGAATARREPGRSPAPLLVPGPAPRRGRSHPSQPIVGIEAAP